MNDIYSEMLSAYDLSTEQRRRNAVYEISQQIVLSGLSHGGFFDVAAFYGGTCLRMFYGMERFSEDLEWYVRHKTPLSFRHLRERIREFNGVDMTWEEFRTQLTERILTTDIRQVKQDALPFVNTPSELDIWSTEYFLQVADQIMLM